MKRALVIGLGISGKAAATFLLKKGYSVLAVDRKAEESGGDLLQMGVELASDREDLLLEGIEQAILSPGIPHSHPLVQKALQKGIEVVGEAEFALRQLRQNTCFGITGTNGKTTTVLFLEYLLKALGRKARALGNVGKSLSGYLSEVDCEEILIVELSSFQLETLSTPCLMGAAVLNITPNHLDRYLSLAEYAAAKAQIQRGLLPGGKLFLSRRTAAGYGALFSSYEQLEPIAEIPRVLYTQLGEEAVLAAHAFCALLGISTSEFCRAAQGFCKPEHRVEWVATRRGIAYYNDSKATNIDAVCHAIALFKGPILLLAGGVDKGASYRPWIAAFQGKVKRIIAFGQAAPLLERDLSSAFPFVRVADLKEALFLASAEASEGDTVLLSPGCSSFDQFRNYEHRGAEFKKMVWEMGE